MSLGKAARTLVKPARGVLGSFPAPRRAYAAVAEARAVLEKELDGIRAAGTWKAERIITSMQGPQINVDSSSSSECCYGGPGGLGVWSAGVKSINRLAAGVNPQFELS